ncbi:MAG: glutathione S-transferase N-terminal domain-containing protein [Gammaproteobacteria bacterium]
MIDFYTWTTPNGYKVAIMLEETQLPYRVHPVDLSKKEQFRPEFLRINPNNKIPVIVDQQGPDGKPLPLFESGAILYYLAHKTGKFLASDPRQCALTMQWLMFQMGGLGPMSGQLFYFSKLASEPIPAAINRYREEVKRLYWVMNEHLNKNDYFSTDYSIADIALFPWVMRYEALEIPLRDYPGLQGWYDRVAARPAVQRGIQVPKV